MPPKSEPNARRQSLTDLKTKNIQEALKQYRTSGLTENLADDYWSTFASFDLNQDGRLEANDLDAAFKRLGQSVPMADIQKIILEADTNKDGHIDFVEFVGLMLKKVEKDSKITETELKQLFATFDLNGKGKIEEKEIKSVMSKLGYNLTDEEVANMVKVADKDGDGGISFDEFKLLVKRVDDAKRKR